MGSVKFGKGAEQKPLAITTEVMELRSVVQNLLDVVKNSEDSAKQELDKAALISATEKKLELAIEKFSLEQKSQRNLIKICTGIIVLIQIIAIFGV